jgi:glyoxylase-like metal-dependent hydrolase (beta-lactamase superfamily II)
VPQRITQINLGGVNCYLVRTEGGFVLIDAGFAARRKALVRRLGDAGCRPGDLDLVILTHGDADHAGNCVFLRERYGAKVGMYDEDVAMVEQGDMRLGRKPEPDRVSTVFRLLSALDRTSAFERFQPDILLHNNQDLSAFGFRATVVHLPGHSRGSIGVLAEDGALFCGDLLTSFFRPRYHFLIDDMAAARDSVKRLEAMGVSMVYPGHGRPFRMDRFPRTRR